MLRNVLQSVLETSRQGMGCGCRPGMGSGLPAAVVWPAELEAGLTFGELQTIRSWLRNYLLPQIYSNPSRPEAQSAGWYPEQPTVGFRNEFGQDAKQAFEHARKRWQSLSLVNKDELIPAWRKFASLYLASVTDSGKVSGSLAMPLNRWPIQLKDNRPDKVIDSINKLGVNPWRRFVAAMAIGRDLFAEQYAAIGGVQPGLHETIEATVDQGVAVTGEYVNLAGRWVWKGFDLQGRPILDSEPLFDPPTVAAPDWPLVKARNTSLMRYLVKLLAGPDLDRAAQQAVPTILTVLRDAARVRRGVVAPASVPATGVALGELLAELMNALGIDATSAMGAAGEMLSDQADLQFPWRPGSNLDPVGVSGSNDDRVTIDPIEMPRSTLDPKVFSAA